MFSESKQEAEDSNRKLCALIKQALDSDQDLNVRITHLEYEGSIHSETARRVGASDDSSIRSETTGQTYSPLLGMDTDAVRSPFEQDLATSRVYNKPGNQHSLTSLTSSMLYATALSFFSKLSLSEVSYISLYALPVYEFDLSNSECYIFGEEGVGRHENLVDDVPDSTSLVQRSRPATSEQTPVKRQIPRRLLGRFARRRPDVTKTRARPQDDTKAIMSAPTSPSELIDARRRSSAIDLKLKVDGMLRRGECKVLLFGDADMRSDIANSCEIYYGPTQGELAIYRLTIHRKVIDCVRALIDAMYKLNITLEAPDNEKHYQYLVEYTIVPNPKVPLDFQVGQAITSVWGDPCITKVLERSSEFDRMDSVS